MNSLLITTINFPFIRISQQQFLLLLILLLTPIIILRSVQFPTSPYISTTLPIINAPCANLIFNLILQVIFSQNKQIFLTFHWNIALFFPITIIIFLIKSPFFNKVIQSTIKPNSKILPILLSTHLLVQIFPKALIFNIRRPFYLLIST